MQPSQIAKWSRNIRTFWSTDVNWLATSAHPSRRRVVRRSPIGAKRRFQLVLIKPSHYGDDGYVIRWWRAMIPSNSLAALYGIAADCAERQVLGLDVALDIE